ncbi:MAG TPA: 23S rRNA methyltransferase, partial [Gammaproteobacteria bacterium]|nr:23S rRNA methyltransferase [Gammaproteobacteria bacterium]
MARSKSSGQWLKEHFSDTYVKQAQKDGFRSRAAYKLLEINERDSILKPGVTVVDLGAAPGGWTQVVSNVLNGQGRIIATDILPMDKFPDVDIIQGDFREQETLDRLLKCVGDTQVGLVISDMAPNITGVAAIDQPRAIHLSELVVD